MIFYDRYHYDADTNLREMEELFKKIYFENPNRALEKPHEIDYCQDILLEASRQTVDPFPGLLSNTLKEDLFFHDAQDCEIYRHLRYLPCNWHSHSFLEIIYVANGNCTNYIVNQTLPMHVGDLCIIAPNTQHAISAFSDDCIIFNILLRTSTFETAFFGTLSENDILSDFFMRTLYNSKTHPYLFFHTNDDQELRNYIGYAYEEFTGNRQYKNRMINSIITAFFITLLRNHGANVIVPQLNNGENEQNVVYILKYMQEHYSTLSLKELAAFFNYSERQVQRIIKASTGMSFSENVQKLRMNKAAKLLENQDLSVATIAEELGYSDAGNFRHVFKKYYGMTPMDFRASK